MAGLQRRFYSKPFHWLVIISDHFWFVLGEEDQTLAGLVPSQSFQHQRESMRLAAEERMSKPQRKSSTLLCGKTPKRKKKKGAFTDSGYPIYANAVDGTFLPRQKIT